MPIGNFLHNLASGLQSNGGVMAPSFNQQMLDTGNEMLGKEGLAPYSPLMSPYFSNATVQAHPKLTGAIGGAMGVLANMGQTPEVSGAGDGIASVARGLQGNMLQQRQFQMQQAMMPMQLAQQVAQYRATMAPEALQDKYGNFYYRNRQTGDLSPAASAGGLFQKGVNDAHAMGDTESQIFSAIPGISDEEKTNVHAQLGLTSGILDPNERATKVAQIPNTILTERNSASRVMLGQQKFAEQQKQNQIKNQMEETRIGLLRQRLGMSGERFKADGFTKMIEYGINPYTGETLSANNAPPGMIQDKDGTVIPSKFASNVKPTNAARDKAQQAQVIQFAGNTLMEHIRQNADQLGPVMGRYNSMADFIGNAPPEYKSLAAELGSWVALHPAAHGFRGVKAAEEFQKTFGNVWNSPESLVAGIQGSFNTMGALEQVGTPKTTGGRGPNPLLPPGMGQNNSDPWSNYQVK
jgi:hypothetical protein